MQYLKSELEPLYFHFSQTLENFRCKHTWSLKWNISETWSYLVITAFLLSECRPLIHSSRVHYSSHWSNQRLGRGAGGNPQKKDLIRLWRTPVLKEKAEYIPLKRQIKGLFYSLPPHMQGKRFPQALPTCMTSELTNRKNPLKIWVQPTMQNKTITNGRPI